MYLYLWIYPISMLFQILVLLVQIQLLILMKIYLRIYKEVSSNTKYLKEHYFIYSWKLTGESH